jgi:pSer/pThr/pTyr-binding forkhead associated (FHA) protein
MSNSYRLIIEDDDGKTTLVPFEQSDLSIGRWDGNSVRLLDRNVSRRHARLVRSNGEIFIEDLNSFNGIKLNGERIDRRSEISEGDLLEIGDYHIALQIEKKAADSPNSFGAEERVDTVMEHAPDQQTLPGVQGSQASRATVPIQAGAQPNPLVAPPPTQERKSNPVLPPFPASGGLSAPENPFFDPHSSSSLAERHGSRTEQISVGPARVSNKPRLICVSTEYAGRAFTLHDPEVIIGRVEDNDVVIEHRSVSRNHAKIMFDGQVHKIIDLDSANGILVNDEEYAITDLRHGDLIELGHVCFRFIPAGETFTPSEDETKAMLDAGVAPPTSQPPIPTLEEEAIASTLPPQNSPKKSDPLPEITPSQDLCEAATVADTPLNALTVSDMFKPKVDQANDEAQTTELIGRQATVSAVSPDSLSPSAADLLRERRNMPTANNPAYSLDDDVDDFEGPTRSRVPFVVAAVFMVLAAIGVASQFSGSQVDHDAELQGLHASGEYSKLEAYFVEHQGAFSDGKKAMQLVFDAKQKQDTPPVPVVKKPAPEKVTPPKAIEALVPKAEPPEPKATEPAAAPKPAPTPRAKPASVQKRRKKLRAKKKRRRADKSAADLAKAQTYYKRGNELLAFDRKNAEHWLKLCIKTAAFADCHRSLGILFAESSPEKAIFHYRKYVQLKPNADDAETVRKFIRQATADGS